MSATVSFRPEHKGWRASWWLQLGELSAFPIGAHEGLDHDAVLAYAVGKYSVPAVPTPDGQTFWGYTSVPSAACTWWEALPVVPDGAPTREWVVHFRRARRIAQTWPAQLGDDAYRAFLLKWTKARMVAYVEACVAQGGWNRDCMSDRDEMAHLISEDLDVEFGAAESICKAAGWPS